MGVTGTLAPILSTESQRTTAPMPYNAAPQERGPRYRDVPVIRPIQYRPDIDGLRALAVLSVVVYHLGMPLHGGYAGVDIFFTISGFLIGSIILRQTADGSFTFAGFYERRIRRIFPALFAMLIVSSILACKYLLPVELVAFSKSLGAVAFSTSNIYFWLQSGYFDAPASAMPLLHTWSLAVEEQFYIFLPIVLVLLNRFMPRRVNLAICAIAAVSFVISVYGAYRSPSATFYLPHTRAWELLLGTMLALKGLPKVRGRVMREVAGMVGIVLMGAALLLYHTWTPFPGLAAVPPCLGTALVIAAGESGDHFVGRLLSLKPVVFVGLISYSLYLWHWPLVVFYKFGFTVIGGLNHHQSQALLLTLSLMMAILSWRFVEIPFRSGALRVNRRTLFGGAAIATVAVVIGCSSVVEEQGLPSRFTEQARDVAAYIHTDPVDNQDQFRDGICFISSETSTLKDYSVSKCLPERKQKTILVLGDSHAAAMWWGFDQVLAGVNVMQATASGCKPVLNQRPRQQAGCTEIMNYALKEYLPSHKVDAVLIEARWEEDDLASLGETIAWLRQRGIPAILFGPIVQYDSSLPRLLAMSINENDPLLPRRHLESFVKPLDLQMEELARDTWHVPYVSMRGIFCGDDSCTQYGAPGVPLLSDYGHLTKAGSILAARKVSGLGVLYGEPQPTGSLEVAGENP
jgi:peptidoglycan/LPS O-acetylase OafA/YrhL